MQKDDQIIQQLKSCANKANVTVTHVGNGHYQIKGALLVNYYPFSKRKTAYVDGTVGGSGHVTPAQAVQMAVQPPRIVKKSDRDERQRNSRGDRKWLIRANGPYCHWCGKELTLDTSTVDHVVPLARGGLDNRNNKVLACEECNQERGHAMPEIRPIRLGNIERHQAITFYSRNREGL